MYYQSNFLHSADTRKKCEYNGTVPDLFIDFMKAYDSVKIVVYNILLEFVIPKKLVTLTKLYLNETYSKVRVMAFQFSFRLCHQ